MDKKLIAKKLLKVAKNLIAEENFDPVEFWKQNSSEIEKCLKNQYGDYIGFAYPNIKTNMVTISWKITKTAVFILLIKDGIIMAEISDKSIGYQSREEAHINSEKGRVLQMVENLIIKTKNKYQKNSDTNWNEFVEASKKHDYKWVEEVLKDASRLKGLFGWGMSDFDSTRAVNVKLQVLLKNGSVETNKATYSGLMPTEPLQEVSATIKGFFKGVKTKFEFNGGESEKTIEIIQMYSPSRKTLKTEVMHGKKFVEIKYDNEYSLELRVNEKVYK